MSTPRAARILLIVRPGAADRGVAGVAEPDQEVAGLAVVVGRDDLLPLAADLATAAMRVGQAVRVDVRGHAPSYANDRSSMPHQSLDTPALWAQRIDTTCDYPHPSSGT